MRGGDRTFCAECKQLVSSGCAYALCPVRIPVPARGHMPFAGHRSCAEWVDRTAARETLRGASSEQRPNKCDRRTGHGERF